MFNKRRGVAGIEVAIVLIAFIVVAGALAFIVLNMGNTTFEKTKTTADEVSSGGMLVRSGPVVGSICLSGSTECDFYSSLNLITIRIKADPSGRTVNLDNSMASISYLSDTVEFDDIYKGIVNPENDFLFVADKDNHRIQKFDESGNHLLTFDDSGGLKKPDGVAVDYAGNIYVANRDEHEITVFDSAGNTILSFGSGTLNHPEGIDVGFSQKIYVADTDNNLLRVFDSGGNLLSTIGAATLDRPSDVAVDKFGNIYVTERDDDDVEVFDVNGNLIRTFGGGTLLKPDGIDVFGSRVYIGDRDNNRIAVYHTDGTLDFTFNDGGNLNKPEGVEVDGDGNIYVADRDDHEIVVFDSLGNKIRTIGTTGTGNGQLRHPEDIAVQTYDKEEASIIGLAAANNFLTSTLDATYGPTATETSAIIYWPNSISTRNPVLDKGEQAVLLIVLSVNDRPSTSDNFMVEVKPHSSPILTVDRQISAISPGVTNLG